MRIKILLSTLMIAVLSFGLFAQGENKSTSASLFLPETGDFGVSFTIDGLIDKIKLSPPQNKVGNNLLFARYYQTNDKVLRFGFGLDIESKKREQSDSVGSEMISLDSSRSQYNINFSFGYEKHLRTTSRLDPYIFTQLDLTFIGKKKTEVEEVIASDAGERKRNKTIKEDGGIGIGISAGGGFNYFLAKRFSVGAEFAFVIQHVKEGGTISSNEITTPINGNPTSKFESKENLTRDWNVGVRPEARINISYFF